MDGEAIQSSASKNGSPYLNTLQAANYVRLSHKTLEKMRVVGGGPVFRKHGRYVRYHIADLDRWSMAHARESTSDASH